MGKMITQARPIRKPPPPPTKRGRPKASNPGFESRAGVKFIQTLPQDDFSLISEKALEIGMTLQQYIRFHIIRPWRQAIEE